VQWGEIEQLDELVVLVFMDEGRRHGDRVVGQPQGHRPLGVRRRRASAGAVGAGRERHQRAQASRDGSRSMRVLGGKQVPCPLDGGLQTPDVGEPGGRRQRTEFAERVGVLQDEVPVAARHPQTADGKPAGALAPAAPPQLDVAPQGLDDGDRLAGLGP
jgi:hypothetical protein